MYFTPKLVVALAMVVSLSAVAAPALAASQALPPSIEYLGRTGSEQYPVFNDFKVTNSGGTLGGSAYMQIGIFSGDAPLSGTYAGGECTVIRKKQTYRGPCNADEFSGFIYDSKGKQDAPFRFFSTLKIARLKANGGVDPAASVVAVTEPATVPSVWSLGRARFLVEPRGGCSPQLALGTKSYCFGQAIDWLRRHPNRSSVDVVAMQASYVPGSFVPHNNGIGWNIYKVARQGETFSAAKQAHYATKVQVPQGCMYRGVAALAWYIAIARRGKVAVEAESYLCSNPWAGQPIYAAYLSADDIDAAPGEIEIAQASRGPSGASHGSYDGSPYAQPRQAPAGDYSDTVDGGGLPSMQGDWLAGTSADIHGEPNVPPQNCKDAATSDMYTGLTGRVATNPCRQPTRKRK